MKNEKRAAELLLVAACMGIPAGSALRSRSGIQLDLAGLPLKVREGRIYAGEGGLDVEVDIGGAIDRARSRGRWLVSWKPMTVGQLSGDEGVAPDAPSLSEEVWAETEEMAIHRAMDSVMEAANLREGCRGSKADYEKRKVEVFTLDGSYLYAGFTAERRK